MSRELRINRRETNYKWLVLSLASFTHTFVVAMPMMCMPVLFKEISEDLGLDLVQIGAVWGVTGLAGMFSGLISGSIGDRFGTRHTLSVAGTLAGLAGASRGLAGGFVSLSATVLLSGFLFFTIPANVHKTCGLWFSRRQLGLANGFVSMGMALGFTTASMISATYLSPWLGGWRNVLFFYGAISILISIPWLFMRDPDIRSQPTATSSGMSSPRQTLLQVIRLGNVWLLGLALMVLGGAIQGTLGYLPLYLREVGWAPAAADRALATFHGASMLFVIPLAALSDRIGSRKIVLLAASLMVSSGVAVLSIADGAFVWAAVILAGIFRDGFMAVFMTAVIEVEGVGPARAGTAVGMVLLLSRIGSMLSPVLGNRLAASGLQLPFRLWAAQAIVALLFFGLFRESRSREDGYESQIVRRDGDLPVRPTGIGSK